MVDAAIVQAVVDEIEAHPAVGWVQHRNTDVGFDVHFVMNTPEPPEGRGNGVREQEEITLSFLNTWPYQAPEIKLRKDFKRNLPHINPAWDMDPQWVKPCIVDAPLGAFIREEGLTGLINQLSKWLRRALLDELRELDGYWEPMRRDTVFNKIAADVHQLRKLINRKHHGHLFLSANIFHYTVEEGERGCGYVQPQQLSLFEVVQRALRNDGQREFPVLFVWGRDPCPDIVPDGARNLSGFVDDVSTVYGIRDVGKGLNELCSKIFSAATGLLPVVIILAVPRPKTLQGALGQANDHFELLAYITRLRAKPLNMGPKAVTFEGDEVIQPVQIRELATPSLLQTLSGQTYGEGKRVRMVGCGSIGSKVAMHMGKSGFGKFDLIDNQYVMPHNLARMGVMFDHRFSWVTKCEAVKAELEMIGHEPNAITGDLVEDVALSGKVSCSQDTAIIFDATASQSVHDALVNFPIEPDDARVMQGAFYARGNVAMLALEGAEVRQPDLEDLEAHFWRWWMLRIIGGDLEWPGHEDEDLRRIQTGEGCGSLTMQMSDMQASLLTAGMAQQVAKHLSEGMGSAGELSIAQIYPEDGMSVSWAHLVCPPSVIVSDVDGGWEVRILPDVAEEIDTQARAARAKGVETGGYLMGVVNPVLRRVTIAAHLPTPEGSECMASVCILGTEGAEDALLAMHNASRRAFLALGTWHSHPNGGDASQRDWETLQDIAKGFHGLPAISLIWRPEGYKAFVRRTLD